MDTVGRAAWCLPRVPSLTDDSGWKVLSHLSVSPVLSLALNPVMILSPVLSPVLALITTCPVEIMKTPVVIMK